MLYPNTPIFLPFPSIQQFRNIIKELRYVFGETSPNKLKYRGTVKLHGTHADVVRHFSNDGFNDVIQSRNRILSAEHDNQDCFCFLSSKNFSRIFDMINNVHEAEVKSHIMICGEYCGQGIQSKVALCKLTKMFVIFGIKIDHQWMDMSKFKDVYCTSDAIYNIMNFPTYEIEINLNDTQPSQDYMAQLTEGIDAECPVAYQLAGIKGVGEGVVWTCMDNPSSRLWFKTKGKTHCTSVTKESVPCKTEQIQVVTDFLDSVVTETRLSQGIDYLIEFGVALEIQSTSQFVKWVYEDIIKEESDTINENSLNIKEIRTGASKLASAWYKKRIVH